MAAATQYLAVPLFSIACMLLLHKSSPVGTGVCYSAHGAAGMDQTALISSISAAASANSTALALETASKPYLSAVLGALASVNMGEVSATHVGLSASEAVNLFATKMSTIYALPSVHAMSLCKSIIYVQSLLWFILCLVSLLAWTFQPTALVGSSSARFPNGNSEGADSTETVKADKQD